MLSTVRQLCEDPSFGLLVLTGHDRLDRELTWAHVSDLADPTPFLDGGELLLTTGASLPDGRAAVQKYVSLLVTAGVSAIGFGTGLRFSSVPAVVVDAAEQQGLPLFEVPLATPFIALTKAVSKAQTRDDLERLRSNTHDQRRLIQAAVSSNGTRATVRRVAELVGGWAALLDGKGRIVESSGPAVLPGVARSADARAQRPAEASFVTVEGEDIVSHPLAVTMGKTLGYIVAGRPGGVGAVNHGALVVAAALLTLIVSRTDEAQQTMRHLRTVAMHQLIEGNDGLVRRISGELWGGFPVEPFRVLHVDAGEAERAAVTTVLEQSLSRAVAFAAMGRALLVIVSDTELERTLELLVDLPALRVGVSDAHWWDDFARARRQASQAAREAHNADGGVVRFEEVTSTGLSAYLDPARSRSFAANHLSPLRDPAQYGRSAELYPTLAVWLAHNGVGDAAASELGIHRHTLRKRLERIEGILGVDLSSPTDRAELWLECRLLGDVPHAGS